MALFGGYLSPTNSDQFIICCVETVLFRSLEEMFKGDFADTFSMIFLLISYIQKTMRSVA
jgi:hypothetical protein